MTGKERVLAALEQMQVDRTPVFPVVTHYLGSRLLKRPMRDFAIDPNLMFESVAAMLRRFEFDGIELPMGPAQFSATSVLREGEDEFLCDSEGKPYALIQEDEAPIPLDSSPILPDKNGLDALEISTAEEIEAKGCLDGVRRIVAEFGDRVFLAGQAAGQTMNSLVAWRGSEQAMYDLVDDPCFVHAAMDRATEMSIEVGKAFINAGVHGIYIGDAWASASIISPATYEEFCLPYHAKATAAFHALGVKVYLHICGNASPILEMMADTGVDAIEPLDPMGGVRVADAKARVGHRTCLKGGVDTLLLLNGSADEVYEESKRVIRDGGPTGFILGSGDDVPRDAPLENIDAMLRAAMECPIYGS